MQSIIQSANSSPMKRMDPGTAVQLLMQPILVTTLTSSLVVTKLLLDLRSLAALPSPTTAFLQIRNTALSVCSQEIGVANYNQSQKAKHMIIH